MNVVEVLTAKSVAADSSEVSAAIDFETYRPKHNKYAVEILATGTGTATVEYMLSADGTNFTTPSGATEIKTGLSAGRDIFPFTPEAFRYMKLKVTETGTTAAIVITAKLMIQ